MKIKIVTILFFILSITIILFFLGFLIFNNSNPKINNPIVDYCHGIVLDEKLKPITNVKVYDIGKHHNVATTQMVILNFK